jgi:hypothetical protein
MVSPGSPHGRLTALGGQDDELDGREGRKSFTPRAALAVDPMRGSHRIQELS